MTSAARSVFVFGLYLLVTALALATLPNAFLGVLGVAPTTEVWIRVLGVVVGVLGAYYVVAARENLVAFFRASVWGRVLVLLGFTTLVLLRLGPPQLIAIGLVDAAGALWTRVALRAA